MEGAISLSLGGRSYQSTVSWMPFLCLSFFFPLPAKLGKEQTLSRGISYGQTTKKITIWLTGMILSKAKKDGGLDIRNLKAHNRSLLMKWLRRYNLETKTLPKSSIYYKYGHDASGVQRWFLVLMVQESGKPQASLVFYGWKNQLKSGTMEGKFFYLCDNCLGHGPKGTFSLSSLALPLCRILIQN